MAVALNHQPIRSLPRIMRRRGVVRVDIACLMLALSPVTHAESLPNLPAGCIARFQTDEGGFTCLELDESSGSLLAFCGTTAGVVIAFDCLNGQPVGTFPPPDTVKPEPIRSLTVTPTHVLAATSTQVCRWSRDANTSEVVIRCEQPAAIDPSGEFTASPRDSSPIWISPLSNPDAAWRVDHQVQADRLQFSPDSRWLISTRFGRLYCWQVSTGKLVWKRRLASRITGVTFSPSLEQLLVATEYGVCYCLKVTDGATLSQMEKRPTNKQPAMAWSADESLIVITEPDHSLAIVEEFSHHNCLRLHGHRDTVTSIRFRSGSMQCVSVDDGGNGFLWDLFDPSLAPNDANAQVKSDAKDRLVILWQQLSELDHPNGSWSAIVALRRHPELAIQIMRQPPDGRATISRLISELDHPKYQVRAHASQTLRHFGILAESALQRAIREKQSVEAQRRLDRLLVLLDISRSTETVRQQQADRIRQLRCVHLLTWIGTEQSASELARQWQQTQDPHVRQEIQKVLARVVRQQWTENENLLKICRTLATHPEIARIIF